MLLVYWIFGIITFVDANLGNRTFAEGNADKPGLHDMLLKTVHNTATYFGFGKKCKNHGKLLEDNSCLCPKFFSGEECEIRQCINNGTIVKDHGVFVCKCPLHIGGNHCENPKCENGGILKGDKTKSWACDCTHLYMYKGRFCEVFNTPSLPMSVGGFILLIFSVFCICHMNCCKRNRSRRCSFEDERRRAAATARRTRNAESGIPNEDGLLTNNRIRRTATAYPQGVVRLDTIPIFNPGMIGGVEINASQAQAQQQQQNQQPIGPPPSYDQISSLPNVQPPKYTPTDASNKL